MALPPAKKQLYRRCDIGLFAENQRFSQDCGPLAARIFWHAMCLMIAVMALLGATCKERNGIAHFPTGTMPCAFARLIRYVSLSLFKVFFRMPSISVFNPDVPCNAEGPGLFPYRACPGPCLLCSDSENLYCRAANGSFGQVIKLCYLTWHKRVICRNFEAAGEIRDGGRV